jgi:hypothetical protein
MRYLQKASRARPPHTVNSLSSCPSSPRFFFGVAAAEAPMDTGAELVEASKVTMMVHDPMWEAPETMEGAGVMGVLSLREWYDAESAPKGAARSRPLPRKAELRVLAR